MHQPSKTTFFFPHSGSKKTSRRKNSFTALIHPKPFQHGWSLVPVIVLIDPLGRPTILAGSDHYYCTCCPSVRPYVRSSVRPSPLFKFSKTKQQKIMVATGGTVGLVEWIFDDSCLVIHNFERKKTAKNFLLKCPAVDSLCPATPCFLAPLPSDMSDNFFYVNEDQVQCLLHKLWSKNIEFHTYILL